MFPILAPSYFNGKKSEKQTKTFHVLVFQEQLLSHKPGSLCVTSSLLHLQVEEEEGGGVGEEDVRNMGRERGRKLKAEWKRSMKRGRRGRERKERGEEEVETKRQRRRGERGEGEVETESERRRRRGRGGEVTAEDGLVPGFYEQVQMAPHVCSLERLDWISRKCRRTG